MTSRERPRYGRRPDAVSAVAVLAHLSFVLAPVLLAAWIGPSAWLVALWLWFGVAMHGLLNLMHEASHGLVFRERQVNQWLGSWVLAPLVVADFDAYRERHWDHHRFVGQERDTKDAYLLDLRGARMLTFLLRCLTLGEAAKKLVATQGGAETAATSRAWLVRAASIQSLFFAVLLVVAGVARGQIGFDAWVAACLAWGFVFFYGMASLTLFVASVRTLAEHGPSNDGAPSVGRAVLRNLSCGPVERLFLGAWGFAEHATHHREPAVPSYRLADATRQLVEAGEADLRPRSGGYRVRLRDILTGEFTPA